VACVIGLQGSLTLLEPAQSPKAPAAAAFYLPQGLQGAALSYGSRIEAAGRPAFLPRMPCATYCRHLLSFLHPRALPKQPAAGAR